MEKPSTKKPMNILKTMVFLKNFMKKVIYITTDGNDADQFINRNRHNLKDGEYFTTERRIHHIYTEWRIFINQITTKK